MKTTEEWFNQLPEDYRDKALKNMIDPKAEHYSLAGAVSNGFVWDSTPEGRDYWNGVFRELMYGEKFEPNLIIKPADSIIESGLMEIKDSIKEDLSIADNKNETILVETNSDEPIEDKGGNSPDLLSKYKSQKSEIK